MNPRTKKIFILALVLLATAIAALVLLVIQINTKGEKLEEYTTALTEKNAQEAAFIRVTRLVQETETERATLAKAFFTDESDSISFLGDIESFAASVGLTLKTEGLDKITETDSTLEYITMTFVYSGEREQVLNFTKYLENVPYHSKVDAHTFSKGPTGLWEGSLTLLISLKTPS